MNSSMLKSKWMLAAFAVLALLVVNVACEEKGPPPEPVSIENFTETEAQALNRLIDKTTNGNFAFVSLMPDGEVRLLKTVGVSVLGDDDAAHNPEKKVSEKDVNMTTADNFRLSPELLMISPAWAAPGSKISCQHLSGPCWECCREDHGIEDCDNPGIIDTNGPAEPPCN